MNVLKTSKRYFLLILVASSLVLALLCALSSHGVNSSGSRPPEKKLYGGSSKQTAQMLHTPCLGMKGKPRMLLENGNDCSTPIHRYF